MKPTTAIIIGAGIGGLATAIQLAKQGIKVTVLEKNSKPGGRCGQIERQGHIFDIGPTFYIFPELYDQMFAALGEDIHQYIELVRINPTHRVFFADNTFLDLTSDLTDMKRQLDTIEPGSFTRYLSYLDHVKNYYHASLNQIITTDFPHIWDYCNFKNLGLLLKAKAWQYHYQYLENYFHSTQLKDAFSFQDSYIGLNPHQTSSIFSIFSYAEVSNGVWLPKGGMYQIVHALLKIISKYDITIKYLAPVKQLQTESNLVSHVVTESGDKYTADLIVANTDLAYTLDHLLTPNQHTSSLQHKKYSCSTITFFWGVKHQYPKLNTHNIFLTKDNFRGYDEVVNQHLVPLAPHFYVHAPGRADAAMAPPNQDTLTVIVPVGHLTPQSPPDWNQLIARTKEYILRKFHDIGLEDFENNIKFELTANPHTWQDEFNLTHGATLGLHHNIMQMGYFRPSHQHAKYSNLFFVGSNTHPGSGVPTVLLSSQFTTAKVMKYVSKKA